MKTLFALLGLLCSQSAFAQLEPLEYNNPGLNVDLGVGLWAWPLPMDFDGDGDLDLVVNCPDKPSNGTYFFENATGDTAQNPLPVFKPGVRISKGLQNIQVSYVDGEPVVLGPGRRYPDFKKLGLDKSVPLGLDAKVHPNKTRANMWRMVDYDGDGNQDIIVGVGDWSDYGWDNAYDEKGNWTNGPLRGFVYVARNNGTNFRSGGAKLIFQIDLKADDHQGDEDTAKVIDQMVEAVRRRANATGTEEVTVRRVGDDRIEVTVSNTNREKIEHLRRRITNLGKLEFCLLANTVDHQQIIDLADQLSDSEKTVYQGDRIVGLWRPSAKKPDGNSKLADHDNRVHTRMVEENGKQVQEYLCVIDPNPEQRITGELLESVQEIVRPNARSVVGFTLNERGAALFQRLTTANQPRRGVGYKSRLAILLNNEIHSAPVINEPIGASGQIDGAFTQEEIVELVSALKAGALQLPLVEMPEYAKPFKIEAGDQPLEVFGWPSPNFADFDHDGDLDLLCGEFLDGFTYFENTGSRTEPKYGLGKRLKTKSGDQLVMDLQMITPTAIDWDKDGDHDLIVGDEDGRVAFVENSGEFASDGTPVFAEPVYFQQQADKLKFGALSTPYGVDWDGDGDEDIIAGNTAGYIGFFENLSGPGVDNPKWVAPQLLKAGGETLRILAGPNGSIQGPAEAKWGYTTLTVADWDGDQLPDLLVNSIWGKIVWYKNIGSRKAPKLAAAAPIEVEWEGEQPHLSYGWLRPAGKPLLTQWRTTPIGVDWNKDGLMDLVVLDHEGYLALFERAKRDGELIVLPPKRVFVDPKGEPLRPNPGVAGRSGRRKICIADWDQDGHLDIIMNSQNADLYRQVEEKDGAWVFENKGLMHERKISGHTTSPTVIDLNSDNVPDLLVGAEDGLFYYMTNPHK